RLMLKKTGRCERRTILRAYATGIVLARDVDRHAVEKVTRQIARRAARRQGATWTIRVLGRRLARTLAPPKRRCNGSLHRRSRLWVLVLFRCEAYASFNCS